MKPETQAFLADAKAQFGEHWKFHKNNCKRQQAGFANKSVGAAATRAALREWVRQKDMALGFAANEALLPSRDHPDHNLTETHVLMVNIAEFPRGTGQFEILDARVGLHQEMKDAFKDHGSENEYSDLLQNLEVMKKGAERTMGGIPIWGTAFIVVRCIVGMEMIMQVHPTFIKKEAIEEKMKEDSRKDWIDQFKMFANAEKMYQTPDADMASSDPYVFSGKDGRECERFIRSIKSHAFAQQRQRDYEWMADLAATLLDGAALRWYSGLDENTQGNWKLLEKALLAQYPGEPEGSSGIISNSSTIPTPAAAAPSPGHHPVRPPSFDRTVAASYSFIQAPVAAPLPVDQGVIQVTLNSQDLGFISRQLDIAGHCQLTKVQAEAAVVEVRAVGRRSSLRVLNSLSGQPSYIVVTDDTDYLTFDTSSTGEASGALWNLPGGGRLELVSFPMTTGQKGLGMLYGKPALSMEKQQNPSRDVMICVYSRLFKNNILVGTAP
ncbi:hypothetical protein FRC04_009134 [Tulasnella sp. 424]|nr:hypothetical protein FRC04_009134 [Tulasnella sp. 424]